MKKSKIFGFLVGLALVGGLVWGGATFSRIKTWVSGETLTASDLNAEFNNILNNLTPAGVDDYSSSVSEMRSTADPYPGAAESQATALSGEIERLRYQILQIKKAMQTGQTYWYEDLPTEGVFTVAGSSVGINDTTPDYTLDVAGTLGVDSQVTLSSHVVSNGNITTTGDDVDISTHTAIAGNLTVTGNLVVSGTGSSVVRAYNAAVQTVTNGVRTKLVWDTESFDTNGEMDIATNERFTAAVAGKYWACATVTPGTTVSAVQLELFLYKNGAEYANRRFAGWATLSLDDSKTVCDIFDLAANDYIEAYIEHDDSSSLGLNAYNQSSFGDGQNSFIVHRVN